MRLVRDTYYLAVRALMEFFEHHRRRGTIRANDPEVTARFRVIAFDMPWHGKSSPPVGWPRSAPRRRRAAFRG